MGANIGMHSRFIFQPEKYPPKQLLARMYSVLSKYLGTSVERKRPHTESGICVFGWEANPERCERLERLTMLYNRAGWQVQYMCPFAVWHKKTSIYFDSIDGIGNGTASHAVEKPNEKTYEVATVDIASTISHLLSTYQPSVVLGKMDIEGAEYDVLPALRHAGLLCAETGFTAITLEYHPKLSNKSEADKINEVALKGECRTPTALIELDSEDYVRDGVPLTAAH